MIFSRTDGELMDAAGVAHFACEEFSLVRGTTGARPHVHEGPDEYFYVLEGELPLHTGDGEGMAAPADLLAATRGTRRLPCPVGVPHLAEPPVLLGDGEPAAGRFVARPGTLCLPQLLGARGQYVDQGGVRGQGGQGTLVKPCRT